MMTYQPYMGHGEGQMAWEPILSLNGWSYILQIWYTDWQWRV